MSWIDKDPYGILESMRENGSYVDHTHVVYKAWTHGTKYLDKDAHLREAWVADHITQLLAKRIVPSAIIIAPETRSQTNLGKVVANILGTDCISTKKVNDRHTFNPVDLQGLNAGRSRVLIDDIFNNGETLRQILEGLKRYWLTVDECYFMVDRNPGKSSQTWIPIHALATIQMDQWDEVDVPDDLIRQPINTHIGKARNWVPSKGQELAALFLAERFAKQELGFYFDDARRVAGTENNYTLIDNG